VFANIFKWLYRKVIYCGNSRKRLAEYNVMEEDMEEIDDVKQEEEVFILRFYLNFHEQ
jgi:hypothetical protein